MPSTDLERLVVTMGLDIKRFEQQLAKANGTTTRELNKIERQFTERNRRIGNAVASFGRGLALGAVSAGITALTAAIQGAISSAAQIGDLADKLGATTDQLQELQFGAVQANLGFEELSTGLLRFSKNVGQAQNGSGDLLKVLKANGLELKGTFNENLRQFADLVKNAANEQDALLLVTQAFGKGSDEFLEFLKNGSAGLTQFGSDAQSAGAVTQEAFIRTAQRIDDRWAALMQKLKSDTQSAVLGIADAFERLDQFVIRLDQSGLKIFERFQAPPDSGAAGRRGLAPARLPGTTTKLSDPETDALNRQTHALRQKKAALTELEGPLKLTEGFEQALADQAQRTADAIDAANAELRDTLTGFFQDVAHGANAVDALNNALKRLLDRLLELALNKAFDSLLTGGGTSAGAGGLLASLFHTGGVAGAAGPKRSISPLDMLGARRMHTGGLAGNEVPAILKKGEIVLPANMPIGRGSQPMKVIVNNYGGSNVETRQSTGAGGVQQLELIIDRRMNSKLPGALNKLMPAQFGITPKLRNN